MTTAPLTLAQIKKSVQKIISENARRIYKNDETIRYNNGEQKWPPVKRGLCYWLRVSTDHKRHVMIWTLDANDYMKTEARKLADQIEAIIKENFNQTVPIEFRDAPQWLSVAVSHIGVTTGDTAAAAEDDDCPF